MAQKASKKVLGIIGVVCLIIGITMVLAWWPDLVILFKGAVGFVVALVGMFILYNIRD